MKQQLHGELACSLLYGARIDGKFDPKMFCYEAKGLPRSSKANIQWKSESYGLEHFTLALLPARRNSKRRSVFVLHFNSSTRIIEPALVLMMMLCIAVFFWELHCKLSRHTSLTSPRDVPSAKLLLQEKEVAPHSVSQWDTGHPRPGVSHKTLSRTYTTWQEGYSLFSINEEFLQMSRCEGTGAPHFWQMKFGLSRAPPIAL